MITIIKTYKNEQSLLNQQGYFRLCYNQVRKDKSTTKFTKVKSIDYNSLLEEMYEYRDNEYICAGLNSFEREVVVIDNDDETFGQSTLNSLKKLGLVPHCQKVKPNGHSQTYFFIEKYQIGAAGFQNGKYWEKDNFENHEKWKRLTKMMNYLFDGDLGFTGYNCQNPLYNNAKVVSYKNITQKYTFDELYNFCLDKMKDIDNLDEFLKKMRIYTKTKKTIISNEDKVKIIYKFKDKEINNDISHSSTVNNNKCPNLEDIDIEATVEATIDNSIKIVDRVIDTEIFVSCCQTCKSFYQSGKLDFANFDYISKTCYKDYTDSYFAAGYSTEELIGRIRNNVKQIIYNNIYGKMDWNKVGYTKKQRELSLQVRKDKHNNKLQIIHSIITNDTKLSCRKIAEKYKEITGDNISFNTVNRIIKEINNKEKKINSNNFQTNHSIITNDTLSEKETIYIRELADKAIEITKKGA